MKGTNLKNNEILKQLEKHLNPTKKITEKDILKIPSIAENPITKILLKKYSTENNVNFENLINDLRMFIRFSSLKDKLHFLFRIYDNDDDGYISKSDLFYIVNDMCQYDMEREKIQNVVDQTFRDVNNGQIKFEDFYNIIVKKTKNIEKYFLIN